MQGLHVLLRFMSLRALQFPSLNLKRASALVHAHLDGKKLPGMPLI